MIGSFLITTIALVIAVAGCALIAPHRPARKCMPLDDSVQRLPPV